MVYLNGDYLALEQANISVMDRGFLFADGVYEVIPVYQQQLFRFKAHLSRLQHSLNALKIENPYSEQKWFSIIKKLIDYHSKHTLSIYIQITRGSARTRQHIGQNDLKPTVFAQAKSLLLPSFEQLTQPHHAIVKPDIRWSRCDIKSIALLANILLLQQANKTGADEVILVRDNQVTEGASSNVFMAKNGVIYTHPANCYILGGITREVVIQSILAQNIPLKEIAFSQDDLYNADELWISSSTKEMMPITYLDNQPINQGKHGALWLQVYQQFQTIKQSETLALT